MPHASAAQGSKCAPIILSALGTSYRSQDIYFDFIVGKKKSSGFVDLGATDNFISPTPAKAAGLTLQPGNEQVELGDGSVIRSHATTIAVLGIDDAVSEQLLYVVEVPQHMPLVIG